MLAGNVFANEILANEDHVSERIRLARLIGPYRAEIEVIGRSLRNQLRGWCENGSTYVGRSRGH
jgi:hypothetical protein